MPEQSTGSKAVQNTHAPTAWGRQSLALLRISLGLIFLWTFFDKVFGLGFATPAGKSWLEGGSPTGGYLKSLKGWFAESFAQGATNPLVEWGFMLGMLFIGLALVFGVAMRLASIGGIIMMLLLWLSALPLKTHPFLDQHLIYAIVFLVLAAQRADMTWGFGKTWQRLIAPLPQGLRSILG